ncbi:hypothetical protein P171DRAFT_522905 [Karstenula rhodostoma CBS 690.94]|uniref:Rhodopsin domain-containing protein n=1 Tax=Karstenula rhodostoma CBS 690.94 TaxID=1392251 RepID=A0A9P4U9A4_9PLEO|nr:hypothetical protein P171DRAFT_522905 [Karstenula rhodostoma CBS 690.94]
MSSEIDTAYIASLPPSYFTKNVSAPLLHVSIAMAVLQTMFITLFFTSRILNKTANGIEFWLFMPAAYIFCMAHCVNGILFVKIGGAGRHALAWMLEDPQVIVTWLKICKIEEYTWNLSVAFPKLAILSLYMRIFTTRKYRIAAYTSGVFVIINLVAGLALSSSICTPLAYSWDKSIPGGKCGNVMAAYRYIGFPNMIADIILLALPLPAIYKLHVDLAVKIGILITFLSGSFGIVTCIIRIVFFFTTDLYADPTYNCIATMTWTTVEPGVYLIAASMPSIRPLKKRIPFIKDISFTSLVSRTFSGSGKPTNKVSWRYPSKVGKQQVVRTTDFEMESARLSNDGEYSVHSTTRINPPAYSLADIDEQSVFHNHTVNRKV